MKESEVARSCLTLHDPMDYSLPGSSIYGIFQARILEWVAISFSGRSSRPRDWTWVSHIIGRCFTIWATREVPTSSKRKLISYLGAGREVAESCPTLCDPTHYSPPGSSVHGILQARIPEWVAISFSRGSSWLRNWTLSPTLANRFFTTEPPGNPKGCYLYT